MINPFRGASPLPARVRALTLIAFWCASLASAQTAGHVNAGDGVRIYYEIRGSGPDTIIAVHGGPGETLANLYPALDPLTRRHTLIVYDQRGNGRSSEVDDSTRITIEHHIRDLEALRTHFRLSRPTLLGHSWGGDLVALYSARYPAVPVRLILVDPGPPRQDPYDAQSRVGRMAGFDSVARVRMNLLIQAIFADTARDHVGLCRTFLELYLKNYYVSRDAMREAVRLDCEYPGYRLTKANRVSRLTETSGYANRMWDTLVTRVAAPVLVIHGDQDFIPVASSEAWARAFPKGRLVVIKGSSHSPFADQPRAFFQEIERFMASP